MIARHVMPWHPACSGGGRLCRDVPEESCPHLLPPAHARWVMAAVVHISKVARSPLRQSGDVQKNEPERRGCLVIESKSAIIDSEDTGLGVH